MIKITNDLELKNGKDNMLVFEHHILYNIKSDSFLSDSLLFTDYIYPAGKFPPLLRSGQYLF